MITKRENDYILERRLRRLDPELHRRFTDAVFALQHILSNYKLIFPYFTDHTELHSLNVIDFCNRLIGDQIENMNADEIYILLMGCYFHDTGMGISEKDYVEFSKEIDFGSYFETNSPDNKPKTIRDFHNEFSGCFIKKYAAFFEIPSEEHLFAIIGTARGHRKTQLADEREYPVALPLKNGNTVCMPYLSAIIRLADEIDVTQARNPMLMKDVKIIAGTRSEIEWKKCEAVRELVITDDAFILKVRTEDKEVLDELDIMVGKMQDTLNDCREAVLSRTNHVITQNKVLLQRI